MRDILHIGMEKQLYSYRDTGITSLENMGVQRRVIIQLTDHKTEKMAGRYIGQPNTDLINTVVNRINE